MIDLKLVSYLKANLKKGYKREELENILREKFKDYIFGILFLKRLSDAFHEECESII